MRDGSINCEISLISLLSGFYSRNVREAELGMQFERFSISLNDEFFIIFLHFLHQNINLIDLHIFILVDRAVVVTFGAAALVVDELLVFVLGRLVTGSLGGLGVVVG